VVHVYADVIQFDAAAGAARPTDPAKHAGAAQVVRQIARSVEQAAARHRS
jgi:hypothetical protein